MQAMQGIEEFQPGTRDWLMGALDIGQDLTRGGAGMQESQWQRFPRTREQQMRMEQQLGEYLSAPPSQEAGMWAPLLSKFMMPTQLYQRPGAMMYTP